MKNLIPIIILLASCNPLRHYQKVASDIPRSEAARNILAEICARDFPNKETVYYRDSIVTEIVTDENVNAELLQELQRLKSKTCPRLNVDSILKLCKTKRDTIRIIQFKSKEVTILDSAAMQRLHNSYKKILSDKDIVIAKLQEDLVKSNNKVTSLDKYKKWFFGLLTLNVIAIAYKFRRPLLSLIKL